MSGLGEARAVSDEHDDRACTQHSTSGKGPGAGGDRIQAVAVAEGLCGLCGRDPAAGYAAIGDTWYCHGDLDPSPTCYMRSQSMYTPGKALEAEGLIRHALGLSPGYVPTPKARRDAHAALDGLLAALHEVRGTDWVPTSNFAAVLRAMRARGLDNWVTSIEMYLGSTAYGYVQYPFIERTAAADGHAEKLTEALREALSYRRAGKMPQEVLERLRGVLAADTTSATGDSVASEKDPA